MKIVQVPFESTRTGVRLVDIRYVPGSSSDGTISIPRRHAVVPTPEASLRLAHALLECKIR